MAPVSLASSTSSGCSSAWFFAARISCRRKAPTAIKKAAHTRKGGAKAARSVSTLVVSLCGCRLDLSWPRPAGRSRSSVTATALPSLRTRSEGPGQSTCPITNCRAKRRPAGTSRAAASGRSGTEDRNGTGRHVSASLRQLPTHARPGRLLNARSRHRCLMPGRTPNARTRALPLPPRGPSSCIGQRHIGHASRETAHSPVA